jgi:hypothetical protein
MRFPYFWAAVVATLAMQPTCSPAASPPPAATESANNAFLALPQLATPDTYKGLGFESLDEVKVATLGVPFQVFMVRLDALKRYEAGTDPKSLLVNAHELLYPIAVAGQERLSMTMREIDGKWEVAGFGKAQLAKALVRTRARHTEGLKTPIESVFAVNVPALNLHFIAHEIGDELMLVPLASDASLNLEEGRAMAAQTLFMALAPRARSLKTGPYIAD